MKYQMGSLNDNFLTALEAGKSRIKSLTNWVSGEGSHPGLQVAAFSLRSHLAFSWCRSVEKETPPRPPVL